MYMNARWFGNDDKAHVNVMVKRREHSLEITLSDRMTAAAYDRSIAGREEPGDHCDDEVIKRFGFDEFAPFAREKKFAFTIRKKKHKGTVEYNPAFLPIVGRFFDTLRISIDGRDVELKGPDFG